MSTAHVVLVCLTALVIATEKFAFDAMHEAWRDDRIIEQIVRYYKAHPDEKPNEHRPSIEIQPGDYAQRL